MALAAAVPGGYGIVAFLRPVPRAIVSPGEDRRHRHILSLFAGDVPLGASQLAESLSGVAVLQGTFERDHYRRRSEFLLTPWLRDYPMEPVHEGTVSSRSDPPLSLPGDIPDSEPGVLRRRACLEAGGRGD